MHKPPSQIADLSPQEKRALLAELLQRKARQSSTVLPLSYGQKSLWLTHRLAPTSWAYNVLFSARILSQVNTAALQQALQTLIDRHPILRTTYICHEETLAQQVHAHLPMDFAARDAATWNGPAVSDYLMQEARRPFDLERGPVMRARLVSRATTDHAFLLVVHHIAVDLWALGILLDELRVVYEAIATDTPVMLPALHRQYSDYVRWQSHMIQSEAGERLWAYWQRQLAGELPRLQLPTDRPRPPQQTDAGATYPFELSSALTRQLKALAKAADATLYMTLLAAFYTLLHRYSGQEDILLGTFTADRIRPEFRKVVGYFVNPVVLRADMRDDPPFHRFLSQVRQTVLEALKHQEYPFPLLVERLQPRRQADGPPLFQVAFVFQQLHQQAELLSCFVPGHIGTQIEFGGLLLEPFALPQQEGQFDLLLEMAEVGESLYGGLKYNTDLFDTATMARLAGHLEAVLQGIVADPTRPLSDLPLLTGHERQQLLQRQTATTVDPVVERCLHEGFEAQVAQTPDAVAVVFADQRLTYQELNRQANRLARYLRSLGVGAETLVGLCVDRSVDMVIGILGILKAGGAYVPLDPAYPPERLAFMLTDAQVSVLLTQAHLKARFPEPTVQLVCLDTERARWAGQHETNLPRHATPANLAYVIYTSGSTGTPKGVLVTHGNVVRLFTATQAWFQFTARDVWTLFHSVAFDFSVWELWGALLHGGQLVVVPYAVSRSPAAFYALLREARVTVLNQTPSAFRQLAHAEEELGASADALALRLVVFGGEALDVRSLQSWFTRHGEHQPRLVNMYGITETTVHVTYRPLTLADVRETVGSPIGEPIPDLQVYVLDAHQNLVPVGVPGELYVGGAGLARGYLHRPALTAERFVSHPFDPTPGARLYKSGDLARYGPDGRLDYLGRIDHQVKIRGYRIELGEIEATLGQHPTVHQAVVMSREDTPGDKRLVAYLMPKPGALADPTAWRDFVKQRLPDYMIPAAFVIVDTLPLTTNGKVDYRALPAPDHARPELRSAFVAPQTPLEDALADIWSQVLGVDQVGRYDNFFDLGGDSIRSVQIQARARSQGLDVSLPDLFQYQTISELASCVRPVISPAADARPQGAFALISPEERRRLPDDVEDAYPLSRFQAEMLLYSQQHPATVIYHDIFSYRIRMPFEPHAWETAWHRLLSRHAILRTSFAFSPHAEPLQYVHRTARLASGITDVRQLPPIEQEAALHAWREAEKARPFDATVPPLLRVHVHRCTDTVLWLTLSFHHAIFDGWSVASMLTEWLQHYDAVLNSAETDDLPPLQRTFREFIAQEQEVLAADDSRHYWRERLRDATMTRLPHPASQARTVNASHNQDCEIVLPETLVAALQQLARLVSAPLKSVLLAAHLQVLRRLSGTDHILTGLVTHGRPEGADGERVLGLFLNVLPLPVRLPSGTWRDLIVAAFRAEQASLPFRHYPVAHVQGDPRWLPDFETVFNFIHFHVYHRLQELKNVTYLEGQFFDPFPYPLKTNFIMNPMSAQLSLSLNYNDPPLDKKEVNDIAQLYVTILTAMGIDPDGDCSHL